LLTKRKWLVVMRNQYLSLCLSERRWPETGQPLNWFLATAETTTILAKIRPGHRARIHPPARWGKQSVRLSASGSRTHFCGQKPTPTFDRRSDKKAGWRQREIRPDYGGFVVDENGAG
jgi:hypothetical protein